MSNKKILRRSFAVLTASLMLFGAPVYFPQNEIVSYADNDTMETADTVDANTVISDSVSKTDIPNWYKFTVTEKGVVQFNFDTQNGSTLLLVFYNSAGEKLYSKTMSLKSKTENHISMPNFGIEAGEYYVGVGYADILSYAEDVNYDLSISFTPDENYETEPNGTRESANEIALNSFVEGNSCSYSDSDWYKFTVDEKGATSFSLEADFASSTGSKYDWKLELYSGDNTNYTYAINFKGEDGKAVSVNYGLEPGVYYAKLVNPYEYKGKDYKFSVNFTADENYETEPNGKKEFANEIALNSFARGNSDSYSDSDWYKFTVDEKGATSFSLEADFASSTGSKYDWKLELYSGDNTNYTYAINFKGEDGKAVSNKYGLDPGVYYAKLVNPNNYNGKDYKFSVNFTADPNYETEPNNSAETADELNGFVKGSLSSNSDADWYKFTVDGKGYVNFDFETSAESGEWKLELFENADSKSSFYEKTFKAGEETNITDDIGLDEGEYYARIRSYSWVADDYKLNLNFVEDEKWESEFNNDFDTADEILPNTTTSGCLMSSGDKDYYKFTLENDGYINLDFISKAVGNAVTYYTMELMDSTEEHTVIYTVQIKGSDELVESGNIGLAKGTYFVRVKPNSTFKENYSVKLSYEESQNWEQEYNNTKDTANFFAMNSTKKGNLKKSPDTDYYKFEMTEDGTIFIDFERPMDGTTTTYWVVGIIDEKGTYLERYYMKGNESLTSTEGLALAKGNYYMHIQASSFNTSDYKITLRDSDYKESEPQGNVLHGDANCDGNVTISDAVAILQHLANSDKYPFDEKALANADVDGVAGVTGRDAVEIQKYDAGVITVFPVEEK